MTKEIDHSTEVMTVGMFRTEFRREFSAIFEPAMEKVHKRIDYLDEKMMGGFEIVFKQFDRVDVQMQEMEQRLSNRIDGVEQKLTQKIDDVEANLSDRIDEKSVFLTRRIVKLEKKQPRGALA